MQTPTQFIKEWHKRIRSGDVESIVALYQKNAVLLGTFDFKMRLGEKDIKEYFDQLVIYQPTVELVKISCDEVRDSGVVIANGYYNFELNEGNERTSVPARFTFVLGKVGSEWRIFSHHSSRMTVPQV
tara:strand:+ start:54 stop:437 length:384 start_codon:yes stop_codon:yes gene_type:complete